MGELSIQVAALEQERDALEAERDDLADEVLSLQAQLDDCRNPKPPTLFGVTVNGAVYKTMPDLHPDVAVSRVFAQGARLWSVEPMHKKFPTSQWAVSNSYALPEQDLPAFLESIPEDDIANIVGFADGHELEHPDKGLNPADVKARMRRTAEIIRDHGLPVASCVMGFSIKNDEWLRWIDPDVVDLIAFDKYNSGAKRTPPIYQDVTTMVGEAKAQSVRFGKPFAFWETGTNQFGDDALRVAWAEDLRAELIAQGAEHAIWFDRPSTSGSTWDASLDRPTAEAWLGV